MDGKNKFRAFIFDWGNVLELIDQTGFWHEMSLKYSVPEDLFRRTERESRSKLDAGGIGTDQYLENISNRLGIKINEKEYHEIFFSKYVRLNTELLDIIRQLKKGGYKLFILSNNNPPFYEHMKRSTDFERIFDRIIISFQEKMEKPNPLFFQKVFEHSNIKPQECIYVDDIDDFVKVAEQLGMHSITYVSVQQFLKELASLGIQVE